jgi:hypothetical protein
MRACNSEPGKERALDPIESDVSLTGMGRSKVQVLYSRAQYRSSGLLFFYYHVYLLLFVQ